MLGVNPHNEIFKKGNMCEMVKCLILLSLHFFQANVNICKEIFSVASSGKKEGKNESSER